MKKIDCSNKVYGRLTVTAEGKGDHGGARWVCKCECGNETVVYGSALNSGHTKSCGCLLSDEYSSKRKGHANINWKGGFRNWGSEAWCNQRLRKLAQVAKKFGHAPPAEGAHSALKAFCERWDGVCPLCRDRCAKPHVDHCHKTGRIRGLICQACNHGLGNFKDNVRTIARAWAYLA